MERKSSLTIAFLFDDFPARRTALGFAHGRYDLRRRTKRERCPPAALAPDGRDPLGLYRARLREGIAVALDPYEKDADPSPIGSMLIESRQAPARIRVPHVRASFLDRGAAAGGEGRGAEPFVPVDWDVALDLVGRPSSMRIRKTLRQRGDLRRLLRLGQRRAFPSCAEPAASVSQYDRRLCAVGAEL